MPTELQERLSTNFFIKDKSFTADNLSGITNREGGLFKECTFSRVAFDGSTFKVRFYGCAFIGCSGQVCFQDSKFADCMFRDCVHPRSNFNAIFAVVHLTKCDFSQSTLNKAKFKKVVIHDCLLNEVLFGSLKGVDWHNNRVDHAILQTPQEFLYHHYRCNGDGLLVNVIITNDLPYIRQFVDDKIYYTAVCDPSPVLKSSGLLCVPDTQLDIRPYEKCEKRKGVIEYKDLVSVVVPIGSGGMIRANRVRMLD